MAREYKKRGRYSAEPDPERCKARVADRYLGARQCQRKPWKDGWCKQHHSESEAKRNEEREARWKRQQENTHWAKLRRCNEVRKRYGDALFKIKELLEDGDASEAYAVAVLALRE